MTFWIIAIAMLAVALAFVVLPLLKKPQTEASRRREQNIQIAREQLAELEAEFKAGSIEQDVYTQSREELELALHESLSGLGETGLEADARRPWFGLVVAGLFVPACSLGLYMMLGSPDMALAPTNKAQQAVANARQGKATQTDVDTMVTTLREKLEAQPENLTGWMMLGRSYMVMQRFDDAVYSYGKAQGLAPEDPQVLLPLADATAMTQGGRLAGKPLELVSKVLELEPENTMGLWLAGMAATQDNDQNSAIQYWSKLEKLLPPGSDDRIEVRRMLSDLGAKPSAEPQAPQAVGAAGSAISVEVALDATLASLASPEDVVFVYAKAITGPPMPLAAVKYRVSDLPVKVSLGDAQAMMPQMKLSGHKQVTVGARVSKSGQPVAAAGDLFAEKSPVDLGASVVLTINQVK